MKKIINFIVLSLCILSLASCKDDNSGTYNYDTTSNVKIVSSDITFTAAGGNGTIQVEAPGAITASADQAWCTVAVSGSTVNVTVPELDKLEGRSSLITIKSGSESTSVTASQAGFIFDLSAGSSIMGDDTQHTLTYSLRHTLPITIKQNKDWYKATLEGDSLKISYTENATGHPRFDYLYYKCGTVNDSIRVGQYEFNKDIAGDYAFYGYSISSRKNSYLNATLSMDKTGAVTINFTDFDWSLPVTFDYNKASLSVFGGVGMGTFTSGSTSYNVSTCFWDGDKGYLTWNSDVSYTATFDYDEEGSTTYAPFMDNGSWSGYNINIFRFEYYLGTSRKGYLLAYMNPTLIHF
jgi:hypothetical protein